MVCRWSKNANVICEISLIMMHYWQDIHTGKTPIIAENKIEGTLLTLLRIPFLGRIGSISYVLPIRQNIDILNRDIRVLRS